MLTSETDGAPENVKNNPFLSLVSNCEDTTSPSRDHCEVTVRQNVGSEDLTSNSSNSKDLLCISPPPINYKDSSTSDYKDFRPYVHPFPVQKFVDCDVNYDTNHEHDYCTKILPQVLTDIGSLPKDIKNHDRIITLSESRGVIHEKFLHHLAQRDIKVYRVSSCSETICEGKRLLLVGSHVFDTTLRCTQYNKHFLNHKRYSKHVLSHDRNEKKLFGECPQKSYKKCQFCDKYIALTLFVAHLKEHKEKEKVTRRARRKLVKYFECGSCSEKFTLKEDYDNHLQVHPITCDLCGKTFANKISVHAHKVSHNPPNSFVCEVCGKGYKAKKALRTHMQVHEENHIYMCDKCPKIFKMKDRLRRHILYVHGSTSCLQCADCGKMFKDNTTLQSHYSLIHLKLKPYQCQICDEKFGRLDYLRNHVTVHTGESVPCKVCGKFFQNMVNLKMHLRTHVVQQRYACKFCELTYKNMVSVKRHESSHFTSGAKFRCNICWKRLQTAEELDRHTATHTNPRYSCEKCGGLFHRKYLLDNHYLLVHVTPEDFEKSNEIVYDGLQEFTDVL